MVRTTCTFCADTGVRLRRLGARSGALPGGHDLARRLLDGAPSFDAHRLSFLEVLVDGEELLDLLAQRQRQVLERLIRVPVGIVQRDADDLVIYALLVAHL